MKKILLASLFASSLLAPLSQAADYVIDTKGAHASINFKIQHLGYSWLTGRFDTFSGNFSYDADNLADAKIEVNIDTTSVNSNHSERDKHLRGGKYLNVDKFSNAKFVSSSITDQGDNKLLVKGTFTLHGVSKEIAIDAVKIGEGKDPWGGYRVGFSGTTTIGLKDFGIKANLGPKSTHVDISLHIEGIRK
ncbi:YceI family protein [Thalassotalea sp. PLHSN55]|uniref:YceI family protein n=1 Tax=Thalassotalea sp. PLHSN55 TaxID=3435888 RepID=UPI003F87540A